MQSIHDYLQPNTTIHMAGIGGVSMHALADLLLRRGIRVTGSDWVEKPELDMLRGWGATVQAGHDPERALQANCVVRSAAIHDDNPEIAGARARGIPVFERGDLLGALMGEYERALCIAATHGKTTTTAMAAMIALEAGLDPTILNGGTMVALDSCHRIGGNSLMIAEACEYSNTYHRFQPTHAVINNIENDHPDFFTGGLPQIITSFRTFAERVPADGTVIYNRDCPNTAAAVDGLNRRLVSFGMDSAADIHAAGLRYTNGCGMFTILAEGKPYAGVRLAIPGSVNVYNALAAAASAWSLGIPGEAAGNAVSQFQCAARRYEFKGWLNGAKVYEDYAHHPTAIKTLIDTARELAGGGRVCIAFQPHTFTRTTALFPDFVKALSQADTAILIEVFAAREKCPPGGKDSADLAAAIPGAMLAESFAHAAELARITCMEGDILVVAGAGDAPAAVIKQLKLTELRE
jgi:UDP-N-acetylmuramate--alanine ligase